jgi:hypothetical protein
MIEVKVNQSDFDRVINAINGIERVVLNLKDSITEESAREFSDALKQNITSQKFGDFGAPHKDWKKGQSNEDKYWLWLGTALKSISPKKLFSRATISKWFVGFDYGGGSSVGPTVSKRIAKIKTGAVIMKKGQRMVVKRVLTPEQSRMKTVLQARAAEARMAKAAAATGVRHIDPTGYVLQKKTQGGRIISFGKEIKQKKIISDTSND